MALCTYSLQTVVLELAIRAGMDPRNLDVERLQEQQVRGFTVINQYPCTEALRTLSQVFLFDPSSYDARVHFVPRGDDAVAVVQEDDMLDDDEDIDQTRRADPIAIPRVLHLNYFGTQASLAPNKQSSERSGDRRATGEVSLQTAVILSEQEAAEVVAINHKIMIEDQRGELKFSLPDNWIELVPAHALIVQWNGQSERARIIKIQTHDGYQAYTLTRDRQSAYTAIVQAIPPAEPTTPPNSQPGPTLIFPLDIHILRDADDNTGLSYYVAVTGMLGAWTGATVELSYDGGQNYVDESSTTVSSVIGETTRTIGDHPQAIPDEVNTLRVQIHTPFAELDTISDAALLSGENLAIVGDELIQFRDAVEVYDGVWELSYLLRGRKGSTTVPHAIGERFVLLDRGTLSFVPASLPDIGRTLTFRATSFGTSPDDGLVVSMVYTGRSQIEREVGYLSARRSGSDAIVEWQGIGRLGAGGAVAHGARFTGYRVTFDDGALVQSVETTAQSLTHNVGAFSAPLSIRVVQLNSLTGAGPATEVVLT